MELYPNLCSTKTQHLVLPQSERSLTDEDQNFYWCAFDKHKRDTLRRHSEHAEVKDTITELFDYKGEISHLKPDL